MKRFASVSSVVLGLALIAGSLFAGCASYSSNTRTSSVAQAAFIAASVAICTLGDDPRSHYESVDLTNVTETVPEDLLTDDFHFDAVTHEALPESNSSHETVPSAALASDP